MDPNIPAQPNQNEIPITQPNPPSQPTTQQPLDQQPIQQDTTPQQQVNQVLTSRNKSKLALLIIILLIIIFGGITYYLTTKQSKQIVENRPVTQNQLTVQNKQNQITPTPTSNPTVDWQTYRNAKYGFETKYPSNWKIKEESVDEFSKNLTAIFAPLKEEKEVEFSIDIGDIDLLSPMELNEFVDWYLGKIDKDITIVESADIMLSNLPAHKIVFIPKEIPDTKRMQITAIKDKFFSYFLAYSAKTEKYPEFIDEINKMINSFEIVSSPSYKR